MNMRLKTLFFCLSLLFPLLSFAVVQQASIVTRPGIATPPIKYYFDPSSALGNGVNHALRITVSASNSEKTAVRFNSVQLFDQAGAPVGMNVASQTDALSQTPYSFTFQNFGISPEDLKKVAGVQLTFLDLGGENPTGNVKIAGISVSTTRDTGDACIIADPFILKTPEKPPITVASIQESRPRVLVGGMTGSSGSAASAGPNSAGTGADDDSTGSFAWGGPHTNIMTSNNIYDSAFFPSAGLTVHYLKATNFSFSIPSGATIDGIVVEVEKAKSGSGTITDARARIVKGGTIGSTDKSNASAWPTSDTYTTYGSPSDVWGDSWASGDINASNFGFAISAVSSGSSATASVDHIRITINYTTAGASIYDAFADLASAVSNWLACFISKTSVCGK